MKYLFFDIECANGHDICSFGYVLTDEALNVESKGDLLINPQCAFRLGRYKGAPEIKLAYTEKEFRRSPTFAGRYDEIAALLTAPDVVILGHSVDSDIKFLETACKRYNKPQFAIDAYDTQKIYAALGEDHQCRGLDKIVAELGISTDGLAEHKSCDDAEMTMLVAKELCKREGCGMSELLAAHGDCLINLASMERVHRLSQLRKTMKSRQKLHPESLSWPTVSVAETVVPQDFEGRLQMVKELYKRRYAYSLDADNCTYLVVNDGEEDETAVPKKITVGMLSKMLRLKLNEHCEAAVVNTATASLKNAFATASARKRRHRSKKSG